MLPSTKRSLTRSQVRLGAAPAITLLMMPLALLSHWLNHNPLLYGLLYLTLPCVAFIHLLLLFDEQALPRIDSLFYALVHLPMAFVVWVFALLFATNATSF